MQMNFQLDCRAVLPAISAPTLVVHRQGDPIVPVEHGRWLADKGSDDNAFATNSTDCTNFDGEFGFTTTRGAYCCLEWMKY